MPGCHICSYSGARPRVAANIWAYRKRFWTRNPFAQAAAGIGRIHQASTCPKPDSGAFWPEEPLSSIRRILSSGRWRAASAPEGGQ